MMSEGLSLTGPLRWCQQSSFTRRLWTTGLNPITAAGKCLQERQQCNPEEKLWLSMTLKISLWNQLMKLNFTIIWAANLSLWIVRCKPLKAARQCGETKFPLSETICWSACSQSTGSSCIPSECTLGQSSDAEQRQRHPEWGLAFNTSSAEKVSCLGAQSMSLGVKQATHLC